MVMFIFSVLDLLSQSLFKKSVGILMLPDLSTSSLLAETGSQWIFLFYYIKLFCMLIFISFTLSHWLDHYLYNYFATTFSLFLFCYSFEIKKHAILAHLTYGQIL